ncbi:hypothetical protein yberc0001_3040 [Yersinia bercovieri ATCC 43970]|uniref:Uncharacterized protein n=1 Tax=Yersinia bercovieri ATCC 43970 TaxID=349968 RepID=A0ABM9Y0B2_YERBE|nr:hypothetical protein yberc0001_3040 [Yersinia bercovieri ATCC 43970]
MALFIRYELVNKWLYCINGNHSAAVVLSPGKCSLLPDCTYIQL